MKQKADKWANNIKARSKKKELKTQPETVIKVQIALRAKVTRVEEECNEQQ